MVLYTPQSDDGITFRCGQTARMTVEKYGLAVPAE